MISDAVMDPDNIRLQEHVSKQVEEQGLNDSQAALLLAQVI